MKKKILSLILTMVIVFSLFAVMPLPVFAETSGVYTYTISNGEATITKCDASASGDIVIPSTLGGYQVTKIGEYVFYDCKSLSGVIIPDSITSIGVGAFRGAESLSNITIPDSVTSIGKEAFCDTKYYNTDENWEDDVLYIGKHLIEAKLTILGACNIKDETLVICQGAFYKCTNLSSITIPDSVMHIGTYAFENCTGLAQVNYTGSEEQWQTINFGIGNNYLTGCSNISYNYSENKNKCGENLTWEFEEATGTLTISGSGDMYDYSYNTMPWYNFKKDIKNVIIGDNVTTIGEEAFCECYSLTSITIPDSVEEINALMFIGCSNLKEISVDKNNANYISENGIVFNKQKTEIVCYPSGKADENYKIPNGVITIGEFAFADCPNLTSIEITENVKSIASRAFNNCVKLNEILVDKNNKNYSSVDGVLFNKEKTEFICYPKSKNDKTYKVPDGVKTICEWAFSNSYLTTIELPDSVTTIGECAFIFSRALSSIKLSNGLTTIGERAFYHCWNLKSVELPESLKTISELAFRECNSLTTIEIPKNVVTIERDAFSWCESLESISVNKNNANYSSENGVLFNKDKTEILCYPVGKTDKNYQIPNGVITIGESAFADCQNLTSIEIPDSVIKINPSALLYCFNLGCIYYGGTKEQWQKIDFTERNEDVIKKCFIFYEKYGNNNQANTYYRNINKDTLGMLNKDFLELRLKYGEVEKFYQYNGANVYYFKNHNIPFACYDVVGGKDGKMGGFYVGDKDFMYPDPLDVCCAIYCNVVDLIEGIGDGNYTVEQISNCTGLSFKKTYNSMDDYWMASATLNGLDINIWLNSDGTISKKCAVDIKADWAGYSEPLYEIGEADLNSCKKSGIYYYNDLGVFAGVDDSASGSIVIPSYIEGQKITRIAAKALMSNEKITEVIIEEGIEYIGNEAFGGMPNLTNVQMPHSLRSIGKKAFAKCTSLVKADVPTGVIRIQDGAFSECSSLEFARIPVSANRPGNGMFYECDNLTTVAWLGEMKDSATGYTIYPQFDGQIKNVVLGKKINMIPLGHFTPGDTVENLLVTTPKIIGVYGRNYGSGLLSPDNIWYTGNKSQIEAAIEYGDADRHRLLWKKENVVADCDPYKFPALTSYMRDYDVITILFNDQILFPDKPPYLKNDTVMVPVKTILEAMEMNVRWDEVAKTITALGKDGNIITLKIDDVSAVVNSTTFKLDMAPEMVDGVTMVPLNFIEKLGADVSWNGHSKFVDIHFDLFVPCTGEFSFHTESWGYGKAKYAYCNNYFEKPATVYNHDLARASLRLAMSAFSYTAEKKPDGSIDYTKQYKYVEEFLNKLDYNEIEHNSWYEEEPQDNSIAVAAGNKPITLNGKEYTLVAVAIRGGNYGAEWAGDFLVGTGELHEGFRLTRDQVLEFIDGYCKEKEIFGNVKLWITGYSRAAATTNLVAGYLHDNPDYFENFTILPENTYAYCFECPAGVKNPDNSNGRYGNIFSIVNQHDPVPMVVMKKWGFDRYGVTKYLPFSSVATDKMLKYYSKYVNTSAKPYSIDDFRVYTIKPNLDILPFKVGVAENCEGITLGMFLASAIEGLAYHIGNQETYVNEMQELLMEVGRKILPTLSVEELLNEVKSNREKYRWLEINGVAVWISTYVAAWYETLDDWGVNIGTTGTAVEFFFSELDITGIVTFAENGKYLMDAHYPEICLSWLDAIGEENLTHESFREMYKELQINCPVDVEVYDSSSNLVAAIYNDKVEKIEDGLCAYIDENGQKIVLLPTDEEFDIKVTATDNGEMTYSIQETDDNGEMKITTYKSIPITKNDKFTGLVSNSTYELAKNDVKLTSTVISNPENYKVVASVEGNGNVYGGGYFYTGEFAKVTATAFENEEFLGWYNGDKLISTEAEYRFAVAENIELKAKFTENTCVVNFYNGDTLINVVRTLKGTAITMPKEKEISGYRFAGYFCDKDLTIPFDEETVFNEDTSVYAKYVSNDTPMTTTSFETTGDYHAFNILVERAIDNANIFVAIYDEHEKMLGFKLVKCDGDDNYTVDIPLNLNSKTAKVFVWNGKYESFAKEEILNIK